MDVSLYAWVITVELSTSRDTARGGRGSRTGDAHGMIKASQRHEIQDEHDSAASFIEPIREVPHHQRSDHQTDPS